MSRKFSAIDRSTGQVMFAGTASDPMELENGQVYVVLDVEHNGGWVTGGQHFAVPAQPSAHHEFNWATKQWVDPRVLQDFKNLAWTRIKLAREAVISAPMVTPYGTFDSGAKDRTNITDAILMLQTLAAIGTPMSIDFTLADNSTATLTTTEMVTVGLLLGQKVQAAHAQARILRAQIDAATSAAELEEIVWI